MPVLKYIFLLSIVCFLNQPVIAQCLDKKILYAAVNKADDSRYTLQKKLNALYNLKLKTEACKQTDDTAYVLLLRKLAYLEYTSDHLELSIRFSRDAVNANKALHHPSARLLLAEDYRNLASYYYRVQYYNNALTCYDTVFLLNKQAGNQDAFVEGRVYRAYCYFFLGDYQRSVDECNTGIANVTSKEDSAYYLSLLNCRTQSLSFENRYSEALGSIETNIQLAIRADNPYELASAYKTKAKILEHEKNYTEAELYFKKTIEEREKSSKQIANIYLQLASDYNDLGNFYTGSVKDYKKSLACYYQTIAYAQKSSDVKQRANKLFMVYTNIATSYTASHNLDKAAFFYKKAIACMNIQLTDFFKDNPSLNQLEVLENNDVLWSLLIGKTELLLQLYKEKKQPAYLQYCLQTAMLTDSFVTQIRHEQVSEESKLHWRDKTRSFFADAIEACYLLQDADQAFYFMEKSRAVLLTDKLNELGAAAHLPRAEAAKEESLQLQILKQQQALSLLPTSDQNFAGARYQLLQSKADLEHYISTLEKSYPAYYQYKYADSVPALSFLKKFLLKNNQSFVDYFMSDTAIYALGISERKTIFKKITASEFDSRSLFTFTRLCSKKETLNSHHSDFASLSQTIYAKLFQPLKITKENVVVCTDNFFIPFEALCTDERGKNFLVYNYNFSYVYSARSLLKPFACSAPRGDFIGFAPVSFSSLFHLVDLKQSAEALQNAAGFYSNNTLFTQQQASRNNFFTHASHYSVVTIFSHAKADTTDAEPVLYMNDSLIHLSELQRLGNPSVQLVLLSACQTNAGKNAAGEGIYSLARGFASAGVPAVSATLWKADEDAVYQISATFNKYLVAGMNKGEALRKAKMDYLHNSDMEHSLPYYWANMVLIGNPQPLLLLQTNRSPVWIVIVILCVLACAGLYFIYKKRILKT